MTLTVALLGPVEAHRDGRLLPVPAGRTTQLLARLALDAGRVVSADVLLDELWPGARANRNTLQSKVSQLRRALGDASAPEAVGTGYRLSVPADAVDALAVLDAVAQVAALRGAGDQPGVIRTCTTALGLFRGELLADAAEPWLQPYRARLAQVRAALAEDLASARLESGAAEELVGELTALVDEDPFRERRWVLLITALYRAGRQADALERLRPGARPAGHRARVATGPELRDLEQRILRQDPGLAGAVATAVPPTTAHSARRQSAGADLTVDRSPVRRARRGRTADRTAAGHRRRSGRSRQDPAGRRGRAAVDRGRWCVAGQAGRRARRAHRRGCRGRGDRRAGGHDRCAARRRSRPARPGQLRACRRRGRCPGRGGAVASTHGADPGHQPAAARAGRGAGPSTRSAGPRRRGHPVHPAGDRAQRQPLPPTAPRPRGRAALPRTRQPAAGPGTRRGADQGVLRRRRSCAGCPTGSRS